MYIGSAEDALGDLITALGVDPGVRRAAADEVIEELRLIAYDLGFDKVDHDGDRLLIAWDINLLPKALYVSYTNSNFLIRSNQHRSQNRTLSLPLKRLRTGFKFFGTTVYTDSSGRSYREPAVDALARVLVEVASGM